MKKVLSGLKYFIKQVSLASELEAKAYQINSKALAGVQKL